MPAWVTAFLCGLTWERGILWLLSLSSVLVVADAVGILPRRISRWLNRNLADRTLETLERLGVDIPGLRRRNAAASIKIHVEGATLGERVRKRLEPATIKKPLTVGSVRQLKAESFIDVMGASTDVAAVAALAADLCAHWRNLLQDGASTFNGDIDFIVTPKSGSPILGYEVAKKLEKPFVGFNSTPKFFAESSDFRSEFDCSVIPKPGARALLVDDSSTGGAKALKVVQRLKHFGYEISDFIVLFEPMLKESEGANAARTLAPEGVTLRPIFRT